MHLVNTFTFTVHEFLGSAIPDYAILSHRWDSEEVSFLELKSGNAHDMVGFRKIKGCCAQAASEGWQYAWIDSCCIDKSSSSELSEAINSMFRWYRDAQVCYAYLSDVSESDGDPSAAGSAFRTSRWFTRGWTLQELLAPSTVVFYDRDWAEIGTKSSLYDVITSITGITALANYAYASVGQKMSWASQRETTREEDMAYCLMGLFGVNMPPLYGEGRNAFMRLQLEILSKSDDESIFAWDAWRSGGLLAHSPADFRGSENVQYSNYGAHRPPFGMTNKGLRIELHLLSPLDLPNHVWQSVWQPISGRLALAPLNCRRKNGTKYLALVLEKVWEKGVNKWLRAVSGLHEWNGDDNWVEKEMELVYFQQRNNGPTSVWPNDSSRRHTFLVRARDLGTSRSWVVAQREVSSFNHGFWRTEGDEMWLDLILPLDPFTPIKTTCYYGAVLMTNEASTERFIVSLEIKCPSNVGMNIIIPEGIESLRQLLNLFYDTQAAEKQHVHLDRVTKTLGSGSSISAVMRKRLVNGKRVHVVDILFTSRESCSASQT